MMQEPYIFERLIHFRKNVRRNRAIIKQTEQNAYEQIEALRAVGIDMLTDFNNSMSQTILEHRNSTASQKITQDNINASARTEIQKDVVELLEESMTDYSQFNKKMESLLDGIKEDTINLEDRIIVSEQVLLDIIKRLERIEYDLAQS